MENKRTIWNNIELNWNQNNSKLEIGIELNQKYYAGFYYKIRQLNGFKKVNKMAIEIKWSIHR